MRYQYPDCRKADTTEDWFGTQLPDPYSWLRNGNDPEVLDFTARENAFTDAYFSDFQVEEKIKALKAAKLPALPMNPVPWKGGYLASRNDAGVYSIRCLNEKMEDMGELPKIKSIQDAIIYSATPCPTDEDVLALMVQYPGAARPTVVVCDLRTGDILHQKELVFSFCWSKADGCLYYSYTDSDPVKQEAHSVFCRFDPKSSQCSTVYEDDTYAIFGQVDPSHDGRYVIASVCQDYALAVMYAISTETGAVHSISKVPVEWKYMDSLGDCHYFISLSDTQRGKVIEVSNDGTVKTALEEGENVLESGFSVQGELFVLAMHDVSSVLLQVPSGKKIPLPSEFGAASLLCQEEEAVFLRFESFLDAPSVLRFDGSGVRTVLTTSDKKWDELVAEQKFVVSKDGTKVPYYVIHRLDAKLDGSNPTNMYGYGGYNISAQPWYQDKVSGIQIADWVQAGGIYVLCSLRGGSEYGPAWHEAGMALNKRHCYEDFIAIAEQMIAEGWTSAGKIGITGCSNGGLLMSALVTMRPDLWGCVIDSVPHTDMIHFVEDDRGPMYITEYGNPRGDEEMFRYLLSYSPYHNVKKCSYPPIYIQTGELDNNVPPYHGKKFAARMQEMNQSDAPVLLRVLAEGAHDRGQGEVYWKTIAEMQLFMERHLKGM